MKRAAPFAAALALTYSGMAGGQPAVPAVLSDFQRDVDSITPYAYESFKAGGPDLPEKIVRLAYDANPGLKRYDDAFRKVMDEVQSTIVTGRPAVWLIYNMGVVVKTPQTVFAIDLLHRQGPLMEPLLDFALVTHNHDDHADDALLALMDRHRKTVVSNFLCNYGAHKGGEMPGGYIRGEGTLEIGDVKIRATPSDHNGYLREFTSAFEITVGDWTLYHTGDSWRPSMLNPARPPDLWVCHPRNGLDIVKCVSKFHPRRTVIAHLNELGHQGGGRVSVADALETAAAIEAEGAEAVIPVWGERIQ